MKELKLWLLSMPVMTLKNILIYFTVINLLGFLVMLIDKRKAEKGAWRISEKTLFTFTLLGGGIGTIVGMYKFRHKTQKIKFTIGMPMILIFEIAFIIGLIIS